MTAPEFMKIIGLIRGAFPHIDRFQDNDVKDVWYECLEDLEYGRARKATINSIKTTKDFPPDIATIRKEYYRLLDEENKELGEIKKFYGQARNFYPDCGDLGYGWKEFYERAKTKEDAERLQNLIISYVNYIDRETTENCIDFAECISTVRKEGNKIVVGKEKR